MNRMLKIFAKINPFDLCHQIKRAANPKKGGPLIAVYCLSVSHAPSEQEVQEILSLHLSIVVKVWAYLVIACVVIQIGD